MKALTQDNEPDTFRPIATAIAALVSRLEMHDGARDLPANEGERTAPDDEVKKPEQQDAYVNAGLERMRRFERRDRTDRTRG